MAEQRIKGQEVEILLIEENVPLLTIQNIKSFEMSTQLEITKEGYLGETTDRRDSVYRGFTGKVEAHFESRDLLDFSRRIVDKARRRTPGTRINIKVTLAFPNGDRVRVVLKDVEFNAIPLSFGGRSDYGMVSLEFEGSDYNIL